MSVGPRFFRNAGAWRTWLEKNHGKATELIVGFHKVSTGIAGLTYNEALDEALRFGWIDGVRRGAEETWHIRFTPRRANSVWSAVNTKRVEQLKAEGRMHPAGLAVYEAHDPARQGRYSFERRDAALSAADKKTFRANKGAWEHFSAMPPSYRRPAIWWVSAKKEETRQRRLATLIADSAAGRKIKPLRLPSGKK